MQSLYAKLENAAANGEDLYAILRDQSVETVATVLGAIPDSYPKAKAALPSMAPESVQLLWAGASGRKLLDHSCAFVQAVETGYRQYTGRPLQDKVILDYGCGWGRIIRLMYRFTPPEKIYGCDPSRHSIEQCHQRNLRANLALCSPIPTASPFPNVSFEFIYAMSVFTHLSEKTASAVMAACHSAICKNGLLAITIRPPDYWRIHDQSQNPVDPEEMSQMHHNRGFAFKPHPKAESFEGEVTYGDTSIALSYIRERWRDWSVEGTHTSTIDPYQMIVFLKPKFS